MPTEFDTLPQDGTEWQPEYMERSLGGRTYRVYRPKDYAWLMSFADINGVQTEPSTVLRAVMTFVQQSFTGSDRAELARRLEEPTDPLRVAELVRLLGEVKAEWGADMQAEFSAMGLDLSAMSEAMMVDPAPAQGGRRRGTARPRS